ncbi:alpha/beta hydrolase [Nonomuraea longicatena]|uniref:Alpha/beta hydrolase n=1 Tax=Nonomuraea longicatena TaxID=83682 RepID=A0ABP4BCP3_9ACTN
MTETLRSADGTVIAYEHTGSGPAVVLVGGAFNDRSTTTALADALAPAFTAYRYDRRGRGDSGDTGPFSPEREIEDLAAVIAAAGGRAHVFGHSSGAVLSLEAAARGVPMTSLAVYEPPFRAGDAPRPGADLLARLEKAGDPDEAAALFLTEAADVPAAVVEQMRQSPVWPYLRAQAHTLRHDVALFEPDFAVPAERYRGVGAPVLVMDGGESPGWFHGAADAVAAAVPGARRVTLAGQDHDVLGRPEVLLPELTAFWS